MNNKVEAKALVMLCSSMYEANPKPGHLELSHVVSAALPFTPLPLTASHIPPLPCSRHKNVAVNNIYSSQGNHNQVLQDFS